MNYFDETRIAKYLEELQSFKSDGSGFDFLIHTIGDQGARDALDAIEATQEDDTRHKLTHVELVHENDLPRFKQLGVLADPQVQYCRS